MSHALRGFFLPLPDKPYKKFLRIGKNHILRIDQRDRKMGRILQRDHAHSISCRLLTDFCKIDGDPDFLFHKTHDRICLGKFIEDIRRKSRFYTAVVERFIASAPLLRKNENLILDLLSY